MRTVTRRSADRASRPRARHGLPRTSWARVSPIGATRASGRGKVLPLSRPQVPGECLYPMSSTAVALLSSTRLTLAAGIASVIAAVSFSDSPPLSPPPHNHHHPTPQPARLLAPSRRGDPRPLHPERSVRRRQRDQPHAFPRVTRLARVVGHRERAGGAAGAGAGDSLRACK